jgi:methyl-accepting chemotaxis protein WspA
MASFIKFSIFGKLYAIFTLLVAATVACAMMATNGSRHLEQLAEDLGKTYRGAQYAEKTHRLLYAVAMEARGIHMSPETAAAQSFAAYLLDFNEHLEKVLEDWRRNLQPEDGKQAQNFAERIERSVAFRRELMRPGSEANPTDNDANRNLRIELNSDLEAVAGRYSQRLITLIAELDAGSTRMARILALLAIIATALAVVGVIIIRRNIAGPLAEITRVTGQVAGGSRSIHIPHGDRQDEIGALSRSIRIFQQAMDDLVQMNASVQKAGVQVTVSVTAIAATAKQQQETASEIAATTTQIGVTSKEISATSKELVKTMSEVSTVAEQTATLAGRGQTGLSRMEEIMPKVMDAAGSINAKLAVLNEKAGNITQVITTITKVADQTNLLSLNAAIEAEKAGEYGRGFAVVAAEIRRLADQTALATEDIEQMVKEIQAAISAGVMGMDKFSDEVRRGMQEVQQVGGQLSQIIQQVQALVPRFETVNEGMRAQATGAEQISESLLQLTQAAQLTADSLRHSTTAIDELNQVSGTLRNSASRFMVAA